MKRGRWHSPFCLVLALFFVFSLPKGVEKKARSLAIASIAPSFETCLVAKEKIVSFFPSSRARGISDQALQEMENLRRENIVLSSQLDILREWLLNEDRIEEQVSRLKILKEEEIEEEWKPFLQRRHQQVAKILKLQMKALPARVVYREPCSWSSFIWIDVGHRQNTSLPTPVIEKNSPVVIGNVLVGIIEEVQETRSKVRLISDGSLIPSVRAVRGPLQDRILFEQIEEFRQLLLSRQDLFSSEKELSYLLSCLERLSSKERPKFDSYLAKGELYGSSQPLWRSRGQRLKGVGFNYDFSDEEGEARDLRTGEPPLLKEGDLLITTGFDGIFPSGLEVAIVSRVERLREGSSSYSLEARSLIEKVGELSTVFVLPKLP